MIIAVIGDTQAPYQDDRAVELACILLQAAKPDEVAHIGDGQDFYALSSFDRDPNRVLQLQQELDTGYEVNQRLMSAAPRADWWYDTEANHERRLWRYLTRHPEMYNLEALKLANLLKLDMLGWKAQPWGKEYIGRRLHITHGRRFSKHAGWGVKRELEDRKYQQSVVMGHTHKVGTITARGPRLCVGGWEIGCLCDLEPEWLPQAYWVQGMAIVTITDTPGVHHFNVEQITFSGTGGVRRAIFRGEEYVAR